MSDLHTVPGRSIRIERAARAVLTAYDATCQLQLDLQADDRQVVAVENALQDAVDALRKELL